MRPSSREFNTAVFLLRCVELGIAISDLDYLTMGMINDMYTEKANDEMKYPQLATQEDFNKF